MRIFAIDPGPVESGWVLYKSGRFILSGCDENSNVRCKLAFWEFDALAIEMIQSYGQTVGKSTFDTCVEIGRFVQSVKGDAALIPRPTVKNLLCGTTRAKDKDVWQAVKDRFGGDSAVGTKKNPGPLYGVKSHARMALAVALAYEMMQKEEAK